MRFLVLAFSLLLLLLGTNSVSAQNGTYFAIGLAPSLSFNRDYEPFDVLKTHYEGSFELGVTRKKMTYYAKFISSHGLHKNRRESNGTPSDSLYYYADRIYSAHFGACILGIKPIIYSNKLFNLAIPFGLNFNKSEYTANDYILQFPNSPDTKTYPSKVDQNKTEYNIQLNTGIEANVNLFKESVFLHSQLNYYTPFFGNKLLWHRTSLNLGLKFQLKQSSWKKYQEEYYP